MIAGFIAFLIREFRARTPIVNLSILRTAILRLAAC